MKVEIHTLSETDIDDLVRSFASHDWHKPRSTFEAYLKEQENKTRQAFVARSNIVLGYVTLNWHSCYQPFLTKGIPEIMDLNVLPPFRRQGIGSTLMDTAENCAQKTSRVVGIGVGLYEGYGEAQKLYVKRSYIPDGLGPTYKYSYLEYGQSVIVDDDLVLWFVKKL